uniref:UBA domain-containing protein n=1 Tax=Eutreptiella gymnastica TaxID=73025 RepID=A0A7S1IKU7_9EUGL|mmetsp:Transcript_23826/g.42938  ORF Transcript_23826/g.42938 Transcript_23826/m.42938 type:complete len:219 (+) Transcript_23826:31-687(+)
MQRELDYKDSQFRDGKYEGTLIFMNQGLPSDEKLLTIDVNFVDGKVAGKGESNYCGKFELSGTYSDKAPFDLEMKGTPCEKELPAVSFTGAREKDGGLQGRWKHNENGGLFELAFVEVDLGAAEPEELIKLLESMGLDSQASKAAINDHGMGVEEAVEWISSGCPPVEGGAHVGNTATSPSEANIASIMEMGYAEDVAKDALLMCDNNVERALNMLLG